jgi:hypothetical protein
MSGALCAGTRRKGNKRLSKRWRGTVRCTDVSRSMLLGRLGQTRNTMFREGWKERKKALFCTHLTTIFRPSVTGSDESEWDHVAGVSSSPNLNLSSVKLCLSLSHVDCLPLNNIFHDAKFCCILLKIFYHDSDELLCYFMFYYWYFVTFWNQTGVALWKWKWIAMFVTVLSLAVNLERSAASVASCH